MHLLAATPGATDDGADPVDLGQTPAEVVVITAADTELAALSAARTELDTPPSLRLASLHHLGHPMSIDLHIENCASASGLVVARVLGGLGYWRYGAEQYAARLREAGVPLALLPGDDGPGPFNAGAIAESGNVPTASAIANAVHDAIGAPVRSLPLTAERVYRMLRDGA